MPVAQDPCVPETVLALNPCASCASESELKMLLMMLWAELNGYTLPDDLDTIIAAAACWQCTSEKQKLEAEVIKMWSVADNSRTMEELMAKVKCLPCVPKSAIDAVTAYMKCKYWVSQVLN